MKVLEGHPLNTSDHLPLTIELNCNPLLVQQSSTSQRIDWDNLKALLSGQLVDYSSRVSSLLSSFIDRDYSSITDVEHEISKVCDILVSSAFDTLPHISTVSKKRPFKDPTLKNLCNSSRRTWSKWNSAGRPSSAKKQAKKHTSKAKNQCSLRHSRKEEDYEF